MSFELVFQLVSLFFVLLAGPLVIITLSFRQGNL